MPDWHQYNPPPQSGINDVTSTAQNVNSGHLSFISSISSTQLNHSLNLSTEGHDKHHSDPAFNPRHFQPHLSTNIPHGHNAADSTPLASMVQMQNCIGHYGPTGARNPMVDNLNGPMDPRSGAIGGLNEDLAYRNNQVPLNGPISHLNGPSVMNMNSPHGSMAPRNSNVSSHASSRTGPPSFVSCKGLCCNPDPNMGYQQWEKYCSYQNNATYRDNMRASGYQADTRRFGNDFNFRKDNFDGKEVLPPPPPPPPPPSSIVPNAPPNAPDHRRNFPDYKYRSKDRLLSRSYPPTSAMMQNYPIQNYNYTGEYQKYPYNMKEYSKVSNMNIPSQGMVKHQEPGPYVAQQQKYSGKQQVAYQSSGMMPSSGMPPASVNPSMMPSAQGTYFGPPQYPRSLPAEAAHDCQEVADNVPLVNRVQMPTMPHPSSHPPSHSRYQMYQQKIAMQRFSMENQLRELARVPGYQSHPRYKECLLKYRELLKLQQTVTYQGQIQQTAPCVSSTASTAVNASSVPPINLQFDQNGVLINSSYMPEAFPQIQQVLNPQVPTDSADKQNKPEPNNVIPDMVTHSVQKPPEQLLPQQQQHDAHAQTTLCPGELQKQQEPRYQPVQKSLEPCVQFEVQQKTTAGEGFNNLSSGASDSTAMQQKMSKEFADKPELDVRQFLANWDESEEEDGANGNMQNIVLSESTPVVVVGYENVDLSTAKTLESLEGSKGSQEIPSAGVITFENQDKSDATVVSAQDSCLTISYSSAKDLEAAKDASGKEIAKEGIVQPGSIIQCISNGPDEVPTIHIVDNLEIGSILQVTSGQVAESLERQEAVSFFHEGAEVEASAITLETEELKKSDNGESTTTVEYSTNLEDLGKDKYIVETSSPGKNTAESTSQASDGHQEEVGLGSSLATPAKDSLDAAAEAINLKKQSSFTSEESHNPDDISLPDLPTSECTPISTTLNTPIHSDSEESSERVEDLTISTNPIEVVQNSPIISFTQSPMRREPYDHLSDETGDTKSKSADSSLDARYQGEARFEHEHGASNALGHDNVLGGFEFATGTDKNESTRHDDKERAGRSNKNGSTVNERASPLDAADGSAQMVGLRMTLSPGDYELKIAPTSMQSAPHDSADPKSQADNSPESRSKSRALARCSAELNESLRNIATADSDAPPARDDARYAEARASKASRGEARASSGKKRSVSDHSLGSDAASRGSRPEDHGQTAKIVKVNPSTSHGTKHPAASGHDKLRKAEALAGDKSTKRDCQAERSGNKLLKGDTKGSRKERHAARHTEQLRSISNQVNSEKLAEKCSEATVHHNKHTQEASATHRARSGAGEDLKEPEVSRHEPRTSTGGNMDENRERLRLLKQYRRIKYKSPGSAETAGKSKDAQEASDFRASKKGQSPAQSPDERLMGDKQLCQEDASYKSSEEPERKHSILKTFMSKNMNSDFAIQVTNVNLKLKDKNKDHQQELQYLGEEAAKSGSVDAIKIEINVSCTERNTTEKLLHENIKNAVAETIGHLTSSISSGARSSSTNLVELQCDKKALHDQDYDKRDRSPPTLTDAAYDELARKSDQDNAKATKHKSVASMEATTSDDNISSLGPSKRSLLSSKRETVNNMYEVKGDVNIEAEQPAASPSETPKSEHTSVRSRSVHQEAEKKIVANNYPASTEESNCTSLDNPAHTGASSRSGNAQKKEQHQEANVAFLCRNARSSQDGVLSRLNAGASTSSSTAEPDPPESAAYDNNSAHFDYDHFDVAPNENTDAEDKRTDRWRWTKKDDDRFSSLDLYETANGYMNPIFFNVDELENLNMVPVYTTKDGKITYSPNPRFTYHELLMEARAKEAYANNSREPYLTSFDYYNCSKLRKVFKRSRDVAARKREVDPADYLLNKTAHHTKTRGTLHLEFFNDDADKLYTNRSDQQDSKEVCKKNVVDLSFLEKPCDPDVVESPSNIKHSKTKVLADNLDYEKGYNESSVLEPNIFLEPRAVCWDETMESVKSYSSHIDRRSSGSLKELNFSEIFGKQKRLSLPCLHVEQESLDGDRRASDDCKASSEPARTSCSYTLDDDLQRCEQLRTATHNEPEVTSANQDVVLSTTTEVNDKSAITHDEERAYAESILDKEHSQFDQVEIAATTALAEEAQPRDPDAADEDLRASEEDQRLASPLQEAQELTDSVVLDDGAPLEDKPSDEQPSVSEPSGKDVEEATSPSKSSANGDHLPDAPRSTVETVEEPPADEAADEIDSSVGNNPGPDVQVAYQELLESTSAIREDEEAAMPLAADKVYFDDEASGRNDDARVEENSHREEEALISSQEPIDVVPAVSQTFDEQLAENSSRTSPRNDKVDDCAGPVELFEPAAMLDSLPAPAEESVCDIFVSETCEQNISEFTVIKNIIKADSKKQDGEPEAKEAAKTNDSIIDSKLLCMDSSDCGIYAEERCALMQISEHDFTEDDSLVPMEWETSQIQEDAVNRLCGLDESSIDFAAAANSLRSDDNSLLDNLTLSRSAMKESRLLELPCDVEDKPEDSYEKVAYLRATDCNANTKIVPKLVIKKTEASSKFVTKMSSSSSSSSSPTDGVNKSVSRPSCQPKIPKMIIRNARSRPGTPSIEAVPDETSCAEMSLSERISIMTHETREDLCENETERSTQDPASCRNKIPKMKIKLDEKHANKIVRAEDAAELSARRRSMKKTIPKVKIKNSPRSDQSDNSVYNSATSESEPRNPERHEEKIPILKLRKHERNRSSSPEVIRKRQSSSHSDLPTKRYKRSSREDTVGHYTRRSNSDSARTSATVADCELKKSPRICISEKIPKVIIKRTSASAEFKCELSKSGKNIIAKSAKWQPEVKLERYRVLDSMAKDLMSSSSLTPVSLRIIDKIFASHKDSCFRRKERDRDLHRLSRSNSTSDLLPAKCKQRRMSDYDYGKTIGASRDGDSSFARDQGDVKETRTCGTPKRNGSSRSHGKTTDECRKDDKRRSRSRDNNSRADVLEKEQPRSNRRVSSEKVADDRCDECKTDDIKQEETAKTEEDSPVKLEDQKSRQRFSSTNFETALKELKAPTKAEDCFVKSLVLSEAAFEEIEVREDKEQSKEDDLFLRKDDDKVTVKERLSPDDMDIECSLQDDVILLKEESADVLSTFEMNSNTVIKVESSDDSQTTIEILPASLDDSRGELDSHMIDDGDSEQLYPADAIPTQFELELEITDNSNIDLLDVSMPRLNPIAYSSRHVYDEYHGDPMFKTERPGKLEPLHRAKNPLGEDKHVEIDISGDDRLASGCVKSVDYVEEIPEDLPCGKKASSETALMEKKFCCNDSLMKEVLAAKETLKKCLSKSRCEGSSAKPKTAAEKKQGSSFDLNSLSETHPKSSDAPQGCRGDVTLQTAPSTPAVSRHDNKTESLTSAEKSDKKHSKSNKNVLVKKKVKLPDQKDEERQFRCPTLPCADSRVMTKKAHECTTISLKTFKRFGQVAALHENPPRVINLSEKRKKNPGDQTDTIPQSRRKEDNKISSYKIPKISKSVDQRSNASGNPAAKGTKPKEDNMPILEPAVVVSFDAGSDRDSSRSPPVITNQDSADADVAASKLVDNDKVITSDNKIESDIKDVHKKSEMSIGDFITQLAYHEKATIKHRRYCNLCERWFPTTSRHRRHLAGYQHRHIELTQRRSIHTLFMLFTGKPCPRLMPANVVRNDCSVGELTPLQIAVQDVAKNFDHTGQSPKKQNDLDK
ncbi:hypothetical protein EAI_00388 [Harpegnathos saltator]|uniref:C2H2-type domain-containing protein n=1 Tax=Harpegnathos saltator TaxID=610380 RepID=E2BA41_HARSA|nr:hypothetical protein EAI_00388 [Harpegnathos saltator]